MTTPLAAMMARHARDGRIVWIGKRAERRGDVEALEDAKIEGDGIVGDHARAGKRAVTLIQAEHLPVIAALAGHDHVAPELLRRNIVIKGLNLLGFRKSCLALGEVILQIEGPCPPCSRMEKTLGHGGYTAVRGHGGVYASVVMPGRIALDASVRPVE